MRTHTKAHASRSAKQAVSTDNARGSVARGSKRGVPKSATRVRGGKTGRPMMALLDLLSRRGCLRILWELRDGSGQTFRALAAAAELPPATLNTRLAELRETGLLIAGDGYRLSTLGLDFVFSCDPLHAWSERWARYLARRR